jgi:hypothetical protein
MNSMISIPAVSILKTIWNRPVGPLLGRPVEHNLRMWFHFYVVLGNEAVLPIELCLVPVLITFFI